MVNLEEGLCCLHPAAGSIVLALQLYVNIRQLGKSLPRFVPFTQPAAIQ